MMNATTIVRCISTKWGFKCPLRRPTRPASNELSGAIIVKMMLWTRWGSLWHNLFARRETGGRLNCQTACAWFSLLGKERPPMYLDCETFPAPPPISKDKEWQNSSQRMAWSLRPILVELGLKGLRAWMLEFTQVRHWVIQEADQGFYQIKINFCMV